VSAPRKRRVLSTSDDASCNALILFSDQAT
jgi:hypothetical protein